jgi:hypothetical protein
MRARVSSGLRRSTTFGGNGLALTLTTDDLSFLSQLSVKSRRAPAGSGYCVLSDLCAAQCQKRPIARTAPRIKSVWARRTFEGAIPWPAFQCRFRFRHVAAGPLVRRWRIGARSGRRQVPAAFRALASSAISRDGSYRAIGGSCLQPPFPSWPGLFRPSTRRRPRPLRGVSGSSTTWMTGTSPGHDD